MLAVKHMVFLKKNFKFMFFNEILKNFSEI